MIQELTVFIVKSVISSAELIAFYVIIRRTQTTGVAERIDFVVDTGELKKIT